MPRCVDGTRRPPDWDDRSRTDPTPAAIPPRTGGTPGALARRGGLRAVDGAHAVRRRPGAGPARHAGAPRRPGAGPVRGPGPAGGQARGAPLLRSGRHASRLVASLGQPVRGRRQRGARAGRGGGPGGVAVLPAAPLVVPGELGVVRQAGVVGGQQPLRGRLRQGGRRRVLGGQHRLDPLRPGQVKRRVQRVGAVLAGRVVARRAQVDQRRVVGQRERRVAEPLGDVQPAPVHLVQPYRVPLPERRRADPQVHHHVEERAARAVGVLGLAGRHVRVVDAARRAAPGDAVVGLHQPQRVADRLGQRLGPVPLQEQPALVAVLDGGELPRAGDGKFADLHAAQANNPRRGPDAGSSRVWQTRASLRRSPRSGTDLDTGRRAALSTASPDDPIFRAHEGGKLEVRSTREIQNRDDLSIAYTPGVAQVCMAIAAEPDLAARYTWASRLVAVVTDGIPVFHDDQHGTAIVVLAALRNAARLADRKLSDLRVVVSGAGAAGVACTKILTEAGVGDVVVADSRGVVHRGRPDLNEVKQALAELTNRDGLAGSLADALVGTEVFLGVSGGSIRDDVVATMAPNAIVFALANPVPEIHPEVAARYARVVATGRSDYPNQINNVLAFPGVFRGAFDVQATSITEEMKLAAAEALAAVVGDDLREDYVIPSVFDERVAPAVTAAVSQAARTVGVARA